MVRHLTIYERDLFSFIPRMLGLASVRERVKEAVRRDAGNVALVKERVETLVLQMALSTDVAQLPDVRQHR